MYVYIILRIVLIHSKCKINADFDIHFYRKLIAAHASRTLSSQSSGTDIKKALTDSILIKKKERHEFHKLLFDIKNDL